MRRRLLIGLAEGACVALAVAVAYLEVVAPPPGKSRFEAISWSLALFHVVALCGAVSGVLLLLRASRAAGRRAWLSGVAALASLGAALIAGALSFLPFLFYVGGGNCASPSTSARLLHPLPAGVSVVEKRPWHRGSELIVEGQGIGGEQVAEALVDQYVSRGWRLQQLGAERRWTAMHAGVWRLEVEERRETVAVRQELLWDNNCH